MAKTIGGKKPLSSKPRPPKSAVVPDFFSNRFQIPPDVEADLETRGMEARWISFPKYTQNGNTHGKGWTLYKRPAGGGGADQFLLGTSPDGIIQREEMVLACRKKEWGDQHRAYLRSRADMQVGNFKKNQAEELRQMAKDSSDTLGVVEGYEEDGDEAE